MIDINSDISAQENDINEPDIITQTMELGRKFKEFSDQDPAGVPSNAAAAVFASWLNVAGPVSREPGYFTDVAAHYIVQANSNKDLFNIFDMLANYLDLDVDEPDDAPSFIPLTMA